MEIKEEYVRTQEDLECIERIKKLIDENPKLNKQLYFDENNDMQIRLKTCDIPIPPYNWFTVN